MKELNHHWSAKMTTKERKELDHLNGYIYWALSFFIGLAIIRVGMHFHLSGLPIAEFKGAFAWNLMCLFYVGFIRLYRHIQYKYGIHKK